MAQCYPGWRKAEESIDERLQWDGSLMESLGNTTPSPDIDAALTTAPSPPLSPPQAILALSINRGSLWSRSNHRESVHWAFC